MRNSLLFLLLATPACTFVIEPVEVLSEGGAGGGDGGRADLTQAPPPDLSLEDLSLADLAGVDLSMPDLSNPDLSFPDLSFPDLSFPDLSFPDLSFPDLSFPDLSFPDLSFPDLSFPDLSFPDLSFPDLSMPACNDVKLNGLETDVECGGVTCPKCAVGKICKVHGDCLNSVCTNLICTVPVSCLELHNAQVALPDGAYTIDPDGAGGNAAFRAYCDMTTDGAGWTLVMNQVVGSGLPNAMGDVNVNNFGTTNTSWRLGSPTIAAIVPTLAWKLTDAGNAAYVRPGCRVDWNTDYTGVGTPGICTTGYRTSTFMNQYATACYPAWVRGIGINNCALDCSIRAFTTMNYNGTLTGNALSCTYTTTQRISLWFK